MNFKPLLILIPCIIVIGVLIVISKPAETMKEQEPAPSKTESPEKEEPEEDDEKEMIEGPELDLIIGKYGDVKKDPGLPVYEEKDEDSEELGVLAYNCCVLRAEDSEEEDGQDEEWTPVDLADKGTGYVQTKYTEEKKITVKDPDKLRIGIVEDALGYLGLKFVRYGNSLEDGIDCSNFIQQIFKKHGISVSDECNEIIKQGRRIPESKARPGDIIYYPVNNGYGHVGIYLGDGMLINSTGHAGKEYPIGGVRICCLSYHDRESYSVYDVIDYSAD